MLKSNETDVDKFCIHFQHNQFKFEYFNKNLQPKQKAIKVIK